MVFICCVEGCKETNGLHSFPANKDLQNIWVHQTKTFHFNEILQSKGKTIDRSHHKVCDKHFTDNDFQTDENGVRHLLRGSIPSVSLPVPLNLKSEHSFSLYSKIPKAPQRKTKELENGTASNNGGFANDSGHESSVQLESNSNLNEIEIRTTHEVCTSAEAIPGNSNDSLKRKGPRKNTSQALLAAKLKRTENRLKLSEEKRKKNRLNDENVVNYLRDKMSKQMHELVKMQIENFGKAPQGRSYSFFQKSFSLAMYKQSPKHYRWFSKSAILPTKRTIQRHSVNLTFESGIDPKMFGFIKREAKCLADIERYCILSWDEIALKPHLDYCQSRDLIDGLVDMVNIRKPVFATHALVFMVRGINKPYKQPVAYFYTDGITAYELSDHIKIVTEATLETGLKIIGSVCDQVGINVSSVHILMNPDCPKVTPDGKLVMYKINGVQIIHLYDAPHLIKVVRNNFNKKNISHFVSERWPISDSTNIHRPKPKLASWDHVSELYDLDRRGNHRLLPKITEEHIRPDKLKMKVSVATQIFSETYGKAMLDCCEKKELPEDYSDTGHILMFFNDLFDSINGSTRPQDNKLKGSINASSIHFQFWDYALKMLSEMNFIDKKSGNINNRSTVLKKFESTIRGHIEITKICLNLTMKEVPLRSMNQDGLENMFGSYKACCHIAGGKPIPMHFRTSYVTMILNDLNGAHSVNSNCEEDGSISLLNIDKLLLECNEHANEDKKSTETDEEKILETIIFDPIFSDKELTFTEDKAIADVSISVCKKLLQITNCKNCKENLSIPSAKFKKIFCAINEIIPHLCSEKSLKKNILSHIEGIPTGEIGCSEHNTETSIKMKECSVNYALILYCNSVNNLLCGKNTVLPQNSDQIQQLAFKFREKKRHIGKYTDKFTL